MNQTKDVKNDDILFQMVSRDGCRSPIQLVNGWGFGDGLKMPLKPKLNSMLQHTEYLENIGEKPEVTYRTYRVVKECYVKFIQLEEVD